MGRRTNLIVKEGLDEGLCGTGCATGFPLVAADRIIGVDRSGTYGPLSVQIFRLRKPIAAFAYRIPHSPSSSMPPKILYT